VIGERGTPARWNPPAATAGRPEGGLVGIIAVNMACTSLGVRAASGMPVGAENLCHQVIFVDHASGAVTPPDAEVVLWGSELRFGP
jgi:hypothetical protein